MKGLSVSNLITNNSTYIVLPCHYPVWVHPLIIDQYPHAPNSWERPASWQLVMIVDVDNVYVCVCVCECVPLFLFLSVPGMWRFVWRVSHTPCYQHLCDEYKHSLRGPGVVSQMVQCQSPSVCFRGWRVAPLPCLQSRVTLHCQGDIFPHTGVKAEPISPRS